MLADWDLQDALDWMDLDLGDMDQTIRAAQYMVGDLMRESLSDDDINEMVRDAQDEVVIDQLRGTTFYTPQSVKTATVYRFVQPIQTNIIDRSILCEAVRPDKDPNKIWVSLSELKELSVGQFLLRVPVVQPVGCPARFISAALHLVSNDQPLQKEFKNYHFNKHQQNEWWTNLILQKLKNKYTGHWFVDPVPPIGPPTSAHGGPAPVPVQLGMPPSAHGGPAIAPVREEPPEYFKDMAFNCELMDDPVTAADGHTYERRDIEIWFQKHDTSPTTGEKLANKQVVPNHSLRSAIDDWKSQHPKYQSGGFNPYSFTYNM